MPPQQPDGPEFPPLQISSSSGITYHPLPYHQNPPTDPALSEDSEPLRVGYFASGEGSFSPASLRGLRVHSLTRDNDGSQWRPPRPHPAASVNLADEAPTDEYRRSDTASERLFYSSDGHQSALHSSAPSGDNNALFKTVTDSSNPSLSLPNPLLSELSRDAILEYSYRLYQTSESPQNRLASVALNPMPSMASSVDQLIALLNVLKTLHPGHLPTMVLLANTYFSKGDYETSLRVNEEVLSFDTEYVEAMYNIGQIMRKLSRFADAFSWWWKALQIQPSYWDVVDNILEMVLSWAPAANPTMGTAPTREEAVPFYKEALDVCRFVQSRLLDPDQNVTRSTLTPSDCHKLQNIFCTSANLLQLIKGETSLDVLRDYFSAVEVAVRRPQPSDEPVYTFRDFLVATCVAGYAASSQELSKPGAIMQAFVDAGISEVSERMATPGFDILHAVHASGDRLIDALLREGEGVLPILMLRPEETLRLKFLLFPQTSGALPVISNNINPANSWSSFGSTSHEANGTTSSVLLALAKRLQERFLGVDITLTCGNILRVSPSLITLLYYLGLSLAPSPALYNNLGVVLSGLSLSTRYISGNHQIVSGQELAKAYYQRGLELDPSHPHLLTNLGSLLKDEGRMTEAIRVYTKAIQFQPELDVALSNLANAIKDMGRPWDAIGYYQRAILANPNLPEATCGLVSSLNSVCDWRGRGKLASETLVIDAEGRIDEDQYGKLDNVPGWMTRLVETCKKQLDGVYSNYVGLVQATRPLASWLSLVETAIGAPLSPAESRRWALYFGPFFTSFDRPEKCVNEGGFMIRFSCWFQRRIQRRWYLEAFGRTHSSTSLLPSLDANDSRYTRLKLPHTMATPPIPSVLPFQAFMYPLDSRTIRLISHRNALRVSHLGLSRPWLPKNVYPPPTPPYQGRLNIGYISSDFINHPLAHLMQSVFGFHDRNHFNTFVYSLRPSDGSSSREKIELDSQHFLDVSSWTAQNILDRIVLDQIHILVNLGGYTKGANNEIFAVRPCPLQISLMGFAGTLAAGWCDYLVSDPLSCPEDLSAECIIRDETTSALQDDLDLGPPVGSIADPEYPGDEWVYSENYIYMPHTFLVTDHKQSSREHSSEDQINYVSPSNRWMEEMRRRKVMRRTLFPELPPDVVIFANFNQLYKIDPDVFSVWLKILSLVPRSILWLLRFPAAGEENLHRTAKQWSNEDVASRIHFTDVAEKSDHIERARVADIFLDTLECNAHTVAADVLWSGTPILTWPRRRYKMCSRVASSVAYATGYGDQMVVNSIEEYQDRAVYLANGLLQSSERSRADGESAMSDRCELTLLRRNIFLNRDHMPLFDTLRWTRNIEKGYQAAWARWVDGSLAENRESGSIFIRDDEPVMVRSFDEEF